MKLTEDFTYPAGVADVFALITDPAFREKSTRSAGATDADVTVKDDGDAVTVTVTRTQPVHGVPDLVAKAVGQSVTVKQVERWSAADAQGNRKGTITMSIVGQPAGMEGKATLKGSGAKTDFKISGDVKVKVPFVGKKIEPVIAKIIGKALKHDVDAGIKKLKK